MARERRPTQADVAAHAGVSSSTVSYVVRGRRPNRRASASPEIVERVRQAMAELNYAPHWSGRALRSQRTRLLAVVTYSPLTPWAEELLSQLQIVARRNNLEVILLRHGPHEDIQGHLVLLRDGLADAVVVIGFQDLGVELQAEFAKLPTPTLVHAEGGPRGMSYLRQEERGAIRSALELLRGEGVETLQFVLDDVRRTDPSGSSRFRWAAEDTKSAWPGVRFEPVRQFDGAHPTHAAAAALLEGVMALPSPALLCSSDRSAGTLLWAATQRGIRVPDDLRIIGMGNAPLGLMTYPPLTTLGVLEPDYTAAMEHLVSRIEEPDVQPAPFDFPWELIRRESA